MAFDHSTRLKAELGQVPAQHAFERAIRADPRLNVTVRVLWLMTALAYTRNYASMKPEDMAEQIHATVKAVKKARRKLVKLVLITPPKAWKYHPIKLPGEDRKRYRQRLWKDRRLDLTGRCAWFFYYRMRHDGTVELSLPQIAEALDTSKQQAAWAVDRFLALGYCTKEQGGGRGQRNIYTAKGGPWLPAEQSTEGIDDDEEAIEGPQGIEGYRKYFRRTGRDAAAVDAADG